MTSSAAWRPERRPMFPTFSSSGYSQWKINPREAAIDNAAYCTFLGFVVGGFFGLFLAQGIADYMAGKPEPGLGMIFGLGLIEAGVLLTVVAAWVSALLTPRRIRWWCTRGRGDTILHAVSAPAPPISEFINILLANSEMGLEN